MDRESELTADLEAALARELLEAWRQINDSHFRGALRPPALEIVATCTNLGRWTKETRTIEIARAFVLERSWGSVLEVLKHEMAHQYVHEILREDGDAPHGRAFRDTCARLGIDARSSGVPESALEQTQQKLVERIAKLLALAESPNRHEAEAAMAAAQRMMLRHQIDSSVAGASHDYSFVHLGRPTGRVLEHDRLVAMILGKYFFVDVIWIPVYRPLEGKRGSVLEVCGARANLEIAEYVHGFLHDRAERLWEEHKRIRGVRANRDRRTFLAGVMAGFAEKLAQQESLNRCDGLVWVKDGNLSHYLRIRHPRIRHVRHSGLRRTDAWARGRDAGREIVLHRPVRAAATAQGRLLSSKL
jgi:predicted SprT family Zn-dependent metalloprotease